MTACWAVTQQACQNSEVPSRSHSWRAAVAGDWRM